MRGAGRSAIVGVGFLVCAGFLPVGSCAKGCRLGCKAETTAARSASHVDDLARTIPRHTPRPVIVPAVPGPGSFGSELGHAGTELGRTSAALGHAGTTLDDAVRALPEVEGNVSALARTASPRGVTLSTDTATRSFGRDYGRSFDQLGLTKRQHERLLDAFDLTQTVVEQLAGDDHTDDGPAAAARPPIDPATLASAATLLDARLAEILGPAQHQRFVARLGSPALVTQRIARERPIVRLPPATP